MIVQEILKKLSAGIVLVGYVICPIWFLNDGLQFFPLVSWAEGNSVSGLHPGHLVDANIRDH